MSDLLHEVPTGLRIRPLVTIPIMPGRSIRAPARTATLVTATVILGAFAVATLGIALLDAVLALGVPTLIAIGLVELRPRGMPAPRVIYILMRHAQRPKVLRRRRTCSGGWDG